MTPRDRTYGEGFGTHIPLLASVIAKAGPGAVFEVGTGHASAPLVSEMCKSSDRDWWVYDTDEQWIELVKDLGSFTRMQDGNVPKCAVAFVDCVGWDRLKWIRRLRDVAEFIVVHDTDNPAGDLREMNACLDTFTYRYDYTVMTPWTSVVSMIRKYR